MWSGKKEDLRGEEQKGLSKPRELKEKEGENFFLALLSCWRLIQEKQIDISAAELVAGLLNYFHHAARQAHYDYSNNHSTVSSRLARQKARSRGICYYCFTNPVDYQRSLVACAKCLDRLNQRKSCSVEARIQSC